MADIPAEMVRREEEAAEEHKGLFGRLFGHAKPKQAPQAGTDLELPTGEVLLGADALAKHDGEEPLDLDLTLRTADPGTDFPSPKPKGLLPRKNLPCRTDRPRSLPRRTSRSRPRLLPSRLRSRKSPEEGCTEPQERSWTCCCRRNSRSSRRCSSSRTC